MIRSRSLPSTATTARSRSSTSTVRSKNSTSRSGAKNRSNAAEPPEDWTGSVDVEPEDYENEFDTEPNIGNGKTPLEVVDRDEAGGFSELELPDEPDDELTA